MSGAAVLAIILFMVLIMVSIVGYFHVTHCPKCGNKCKLGEGALGETVFFCDICDKEHAKAYNEMAHYGNKGVYAKEKAITIAKNDSKHGIGAYRVRLPATSEDFIQLADRFVKEQIGGLSFKPKETNRHNRKLTTVLKQRRING